MSYSEKTQLAAYQNNINLELFSIVLYLAAVTSEDEEAMEKYRISKNNIIWSNYRTLDIFLQFRCQSDKFCNALHRLNFQIVRSHSVSVVMPCGKSHNLFLPFLHQTLYSCIETSFRLDNDILNM